MLALTTLNERSRTSRNALLAQIDELLEVHELLRRAWKASLRSPDVISVHELRHMTGDVKAVAQATGVPIDSIEWVFAARSEMIIVTVGDQSELLKRTDAQKLMQLCDAML